jgi:uncharacterized membrane protein YkvA (DUF1232 family)
MKINIHMFRNLRKIAEKFRGEFRLYQSVLEDKSTPRLAKILLGLAIGYMIMPFDLIPDFIPVIGHLDDMIIIPIIVIIAIKIIPEEIVQDCRSKLYGQECKNSYWDKIKKKFEDAKSDDKELSEKAKNG